MYNYVDGGQSQRVRPALADLWVYADSFWTDVSFGNNLVTSGALIAGMPLLITIVAGVLGHKWLCGLATIGGAVGVFAAGTGFVISGQLVAGLGLQAGGIGLFTIGLSVLTSPPYDPSIRVASPREGAGLHGAGVLVAGIGMLAAGVGVLLFSVKFLNVGEDLAALAMFVIGVGALVNGVGLSTAGIAFLKFGFGSRIAGGGFYTFGVGTQIIGLGFLPLSAAAMPRSGALVAIGMAVIAFAAVRIGRHAVRLRIDLAHRPPS